jgi:putative addiction module component (TIGR02574 family)
MTNRVESITAQAARLEQQERVAIIENLLEGLETPSSDDPSEVARAWRDEVHRRSTELKNGDAQAIPWDQVRSEGEKLFDAD